ncbi:MAG TPA: SpoIIE family protein phosphatase [Burkholderiales bacterium]
MRAPAKRELSARDLEPILEVAAKLAAPFDLRTMLDEVVEVAKRVLAADRGSVWLYDRDTDELVLRIAAEIGEVRVPGGAGLVGSCARSREIINVPDCYTDARFDPSTDRRSGYRTRCLLTLPLVDHKGVLVGVMQLLNKAGGVFDESDEALGRVLAAQCAIALQRTLMTEALIEGEKMRQQLETARVVQMSTLPSAMPAVPGYDVYGVFEPADLTGGDTFDLSLVGPELLIVLGDATGHGIGPALSVTQMQAMLRLAFRIGIDLDAAYLHVNNQLAATLPADRFITAFIGLLDPRTHELRFHSGGQGPILHYQAASGGCIDYKPTSFPLAAMPIERVRAPTALALGEGDILALVSDGIFEYHDKRKQQFGEQRVRELICAHHELPAAELAKKIFAAVEAFAGEAPQEDDMTVVLVKRQVPAASASFPRALEALAGIFDFTRQAVPADVRPSVDFVLEELFTNVLKYGRASESPVLIEVRRIAGGVEVTLVDDDAQYFDPTKAPQADTGAPLEARQPGGLGIHLLRKMVDSIRYEYAEERRQSRIVFRKTRGGDDAGD